MTQHLPALLFCIPLLTAISMPMVGLRHRGWCRPMALAAVCAMSVTAVANLVVVLNSGQIRYAFGGWAPPIGIEWVADGLASVMMVAICSDRLHLFDLCRWVSPLPAGGRVVLYYTLILLLLSGLTGAVFAGDLFNVFVFLEVVALSVSALVGMAGGKALVFAFRYLILASIGATFYLLGVSFFYAATGYPEHGGLGATSARVFGLQGSHRRLGVHVHRSRNQDGAHAVAWLVAGCLQSCTGCGFTSPVGPGDQSLTLSLGRILYWAVGVGSELETSPILDLVWVLGALASVVGAFLALTQRDVKRIFAYGGVSHIGLILIGVGQGNHTGLAGAMFYLINDAVMQATLFVVAGAAIHQYGVQTLEDWGEIAFASAVDDRGDYHREHVDDRDPANGRLFWEVVYHPECAEKR